MTTLPAPADVLPHRAPFLFLDRVLTCTPTHAVAERKFVDDAFFAGHFPGNPIVPGVVLIEAMAQTLAYLALSTREGKAVLLTGVEGCRIRRAVRPGDTVRFEVEVVKTKLAMVIAEASGYVGKTRVIRATLKGILQTE